MSNVIYANARARALELSLLGKDRISRMIDASSAVEALKILSEVNFGDGINITSPLDFEKLLSAELNKLFNFIKDTCQTPAISKYFLYGNDFHNAEAYIKAKYLKIDVDEMTVDSGLIDKDFLREHIFIDEYSNLPDEMAKALLFLDGEFVAGRVTGETVNFVITKALYKELSKCVRNDKFLNIIYKNKIDCLNVSLALRTRDYNKVSEMFLPFGNLSLNEFKSLCDDSFDILREKFKFSINSEIIISAIDSCEKKEPLSLFEKLSSSFPVKQLKKDKYAIDRTIPFLQYCFYKLADIDNVRIIMVGLINNLSKAEIINRLRDSYEG